MNAERNNKANRRLQQLREGLQVASQLVITAPLGLPAKVVTVAKYVSLLLGVWDAVDRQGRSEVPPEAPIDDAP